MTYQDCFDNIISIKDPCATYTAENPAPTSLSGYDLFDLPGVSYKKANLIADENYQGGISLLSDKRRLAILSIHSELMATMNANGMVAKLATDVFNTAGEFRTTTATAVGNAGIRITNKVVNCILKKLRLENIYVAAAVGANTNTNLVVVDGATTYTYPITLKPGKTTKLNVGIQAKSSLVSVYINDNNVLTRSSINPNCGCGANNNGCASVVGLSNGVEDRNEAYGIWAECLCECDYSLVLCSLASNGLMGEIVLYKTGVNIMDECLKTDRLNYFTIYGKEEAKATKDEWENIYREKWNLLVSSLKNTLYKIDRCGCVDCTGVAIKANI